MSNLQNSVELAVEMKVMVTASIDTDIDVANGPQEVTKIVLDPCSWRREAKTSYVELKHLSLYILVKLQQTQATQLDGLDY